MYYYKIASIRATSSSLQQYVQLKSVEDHIKYRAAIKHKVQSFMCCCFVVVIQFCMERFVVVSFACCCFVYVRLFHFCCVCMCVIFVSCVNCCVCFCFVCYLLCVCMCVCFVSFVYCFVCLCVFLCVFLFIVLCVYVCAWLFGTSIPCNELPQKRWMGWVGQSC